MNVWFGDPSRPVGVSTPDGDIAREVAGLFRPLLLPGHAGGEPDIHLRRTGKGFRLVEPASGEAPRQFYGLPRALARLEYRVVLLLQGRWADHAFLHGAGLDLGGEALLWMGPSGAGKSSLTLAASLAGWKVLGDDCLMVDAHARVRGIPRLLKVVGPQLKRMGLEKGGTVLPHPEVSEVWWDPARSGGAVPRRQPGSAPGGGACRAVRGSSVPRGEAGPGGPHGMGRSDAGVTETDSGVRPQGREDVVFRALVDEWVLFDPVSHQLHVLNNVAAVIWNLCDGSVDEDGMVQALQELMEDAPDVATLRTHVGETLEAFRREGLLR